MSEDFDKEAEREKLREKYERDKKKRQATEQMSELLLKGATMTNAHCSECGDPVFRYEGQEFCPTCEKPVDRGESGQDADDDQTDDGEQIEVTSPSDEARVSFGDDAGSEDGEAEESRHVDREEPASTGGDGTRRSGESGQQPEAQSHREPQPQQEPRRQPARKQDASAPSALPRTGPSTPDRTDEASVGTARDALVETLTRFSRQAAATEDPGRAREHLAAAREAAEALATLRE